MHTFCKMYMSKNKNGYIKLLGLFSCKERHCNIADDTPVPNIRPLGLLFAFGLI